MGHQHEHPEPEKEDGGPGPSPALVHWGRHRNEQGMVLGHERAMLPVGVGPGLLQFGG